MLTKIINVLTRVCFFMASLALGLIVIVFCIEIVMRYFFAAPTSWATDTVTFLFCASLMLALPEVTREDGHIAVSILLDFSSEKISNTMRLIIYGMTFLVVSYVTYISAIEFFRLYQTGINTLGSFRIPKWCVFLFIPLGFILSALQIVILLRNQFSKVLLTRRGT
ncbi:TRAP transporter small permease [Halomonas sp. MS1]|nr:TRAP transporter small permease [Halomonas sp. MS1]UTD56356.1 TRAP transporter small permease [Halomonas sp. MS1]